MLNRCFRSCRRRTANCYGVFVAAAALLGDVEAFAAARHRFAIRLRVGELGGFLALVPAEPCPAMDRLAAACVETFDRFRAPLTAEDRARRRPERLSPAELARRTGTRERYVREWLSAQAAAGYVSYDAASNLFSLTPEQVAVFADEDSPAAMAGAFEVLSSLWLDEPKVAEAFRSGHGVAWHDHSKCLFSGTERFFRPGYNVNLVDGWLPALDGVVARLEAGARVADVGCGHGASTIVMAKAFPRSQFTGFDYHEASIERARAAAAEAGVADNTRFEVAPAKSFTGTYDLVAFFDCLHDMGDPVGAAAHVRERLAPDGTWMIVEPMAGDRLEENLNPVGRLFYAGSTMICVPTSLAQEVGAALGAGAMLGAGVRPVEMAGVMAGAAVSSAAASAGRLIESSTPRASTSCGSASMPSERTSARWATTAPR